LITGDQMPKMRADINFPTPYKGMARIESPIGATVFEQAFENVTSLFKELATTSYSAYVLVNGGISSGRGEGKVISQSVSVIVTPGSTINLPNKIYETPKVTASSGATVALSNKVRTVVSVSVS